MAIPLEEGDADDVRFQSPVELILLPSSAVLPKVS
jgi:hypothetical protein